MKTTGFKMRVPLLYFLTCGILGFVIGQGTDNQGTEFIVGFMENSNYSNIDLDLLVTTSSKRDVVVTVTAPLFDPGLKKQVTVSPKTVKLITLPSQLRGSGTGKENKGIRITASDEIVVYGANKDSLSTDAFVLLPTDSLGSEYFTVTWNGNSAFMVVAVTDGTKVNVTIPLNSNGKLNVDGKTYKGGSTLRIQLDRYESFHGLDKTGDLTGCHITSDKPVSLVSGSKREKIYNGRTTKVTKGSSDHLVEQMLPVQAWGKHYIAVSTPGIGWADLFTVVAAEDNTTVTVKNTTRVTLQQGEETTGSFGPREYMTIDADKPILVAIFQQSVRESNATGDPSLAVLPAVGQFAADYTFSSVKTYDNKDFNNYVSIVIRSGQEEGLRLDGKKLNSVPWTKVKGNDGYFGTGIPVSPGSHTIYHVDSTVVFLAVSTGITRFNSYSYTAGLRLAPINAPCNKTKTQPGDIVDNDCDGLIDEEKLNAKDDDGDGLVDEDLAAAPRDCVG